MVSDFSESVKKALLAQSRRIYIEGFQGGQFGFWQQKMKLGPAQMRMPNPETLELMLAQAGERNAFKPANDFLFIGF